MPSSRARYSGRPNSTGRKPAALLSWRSSRITRSPCARRRRYTNQKQPSRQTPARGKNAALAHGRRAILRMKFHSGASHESLPRDRYRRSRPIAIVDQSGALLAVEDMPVLQNPLLVFDAVLLEADRRSDARLEGRLTRRGDPPLAQKSQGAMINFAALHHALGSRMNFPGAASSFLAEMAPWKGLAQSVVELTDSG
jgi:hypothetical protein